MIGRRIARFAGPALVTPLALSAPVLSVVPSASAGPCPGAEVVFARGTGEPPGVGPIGQAFVAALRNRVAPMPVGAYGVNYPASNDWPTGADGVRDAAAHVNSMAANCPDTKMVLAGYSQGAAVMGFVTSDAVPDGIDPGTVPKPLQPEVANHVAAVVLFGEPNVRAMNFLGEPPVLIGRHYNDKTIKVCAPDDAVCSDGLEFAAHTPDTYTADGIVDQGADFAASRLHASSGGPAPVVPLGGPAALAASGGPALAAPGVPAPVAAPGGPALAASGGPAAVAPPGGPAPVAPPGGPAPVAAPGAPTAVAPPGGPAPVAPAGGPAPVAAPGAPAPVAPSGGGFGT